MLFFVENYFINMKFILWFYFVVECFLELILCHFDGNFPSNTNKNKNKNSNSNQKQPLAGVLKNNDVLQEPVAKISDISVKTSFFSTVASSEPLN